MANFKNYREESKLNYGTLDPGSLSSDQLRTGALLRIADATEVMAKNYQELIDERDRYKRYYREEREVNKRLYLSNAALKGVITKLRKKLESKEV